MQHTSNNYSITIVLSLLVACSSLVVVQAKSGVGGSGEGFISGGGSTSYGRGEGFPAGYHDDDAYENYDDDDNILMNEGILIAVVCFIISGFLTYGICLKEISYQRWSQTIDAAQAEVVSSNDAAAAAATTTPTTRILHQNSSSCSSSSSTNNPHPFPSFDIFHGGDDLTTATFHACYTYYYSSDYGIYCHHNSHGILKFHKFQQQQDETSSSSQQQEQQEGGEVVEVEEEDEGEGETSSLLCNPPTAASAAEAGGDDGGTSHDNNHLMTITGSGVDHRGGSFTINQGLVSTLTGKCFWVEVSNVDWQQVLVTGSFHSNNNNNSSGNNNNSSYSHYFEGRWQSQNGHCGFFSTFDLIPITLHYPTTTPTTTPDGDDDEEASVAIPVAIGMPSVDAVPLVEEEEADANNNNEDSCVDHESREAAVVVLKINAPPVVILDAVTTATTTTAVEETEYHRMTVQQYQEPPDYVDSSNTHYFQSPTTTTAPATAASRRVINVRMGYHDPVW